MKARLLTAMLLMVALCCLLFFVPIRFFNVIISFILLGALWEWSGLIYQSFLKRYVYAVFAFFAGVIFYVFSQKSQELMLWSLSSLNALIACYWVTTYPQTVHQWRFPLVQVVQSYLILSAAFSAIIFLRLQDAGSTLLLMILLCVIFADSGAYFVGRYWGRHLLLPQVSPQKTWEGFVGGWCATVAGGMLMMFLWQRFYREAFPVNHLRGFIMCHVIFFLSVLGDLFESMLKRAANVKDSGSLLPGHGGILDRVDAQLFVLPFCALCLSRIF